jgi:hypothetical protein
MLSAPSTTALHETHRIPALALLIVVAELLAYGVGLPALGVALFGIAVAAVLLHLALPRTDPAAHGLLAWSFGLTALFTTVAFWSALPFAFGGAAIAARPRSIPAILGGISILLALVFCILA